MGCDTLKREFMRKDNRKKKERREEREKREEREREREREPERDHHDVTRWRNHFLTLEIDSL
jgi:hypothetical protein